MREDTLRLRNLERGAKTKFAPAIAFADANLWSITE